MSPTRRLARPLLAATFLNDGLDALRNPAPHVALAEQAGLSDAARLVQLNSAVKVGGGALLALNRMPRLSALALAATHLPTAVVRNAFWSESDPAAKSAKKAGFVTDLGLLGGLLVATADTGGRESVPHAAVRVSRRAKRRAAKRVERLEAAAASLEQAIERQAKRAGDALPIG